MRQSVCSVCHAAVNPGSGAVLAAGGGGRVRTKRCLEIAQNGAVRRPISQSDGLGHREADGGLLTAVR